MDFLHGIFYLLLYFIIFAVLVMYVVFELNKEIIKNNWEMYRCNPLIMPFASYFDKDTSQNATECMSQKAKSSMTESTGTYNGILSNVTKNLGGISEGFNMVRNMLSPMRNFISDAVQMVFKRLESLFTMIYYAFIKIMVAMKRSVANLHMVLYTLEAAQMSVRSLWDGPIGGAVRTWGGVIEWFGDLFCFAGDTMVVLPDRVMAIRDISVRDVCGDVYGKYTGLRRGGLYDYGGVVVSGSHMVYDEDAERWMRVMYSPKAVPLNHRDDEYQYCLFTKSHNLRVQGNYRNVLFSDFEECDETLEEQRALCLRRLGIVVSESDDHSHGLLHHSAKVRMADNTYRNAADVRVGDRLFSRMGGDRMNDVIGVVEMRIGYDTVYNVENTWVDADTNVSVGCIAYDSLHRQYKLVSDLCDRKSRMRVAADTVMYQFVTRTGQFDVYCRGSSSCLTVCDYMEYISYEDLTRIFNKNVLIKNTVYAPPRQA